MSKKEGRQIVWRAVSDLVPYARNARTHTDEQVAQIAASIKEFGWTNPVLTDGQNGIVAGHGRVLAARKLGLDQVPTLPLAGLTKGQLRAYVLADNKLAENAGWDRELLAVELGELKDEGFDLGLAGFSGEELDGLFAEAETCPGETDPDDVPEPPQEPVTVKGDLWLLGRHRLLCGDSTVQTDVDRVMDGKRANLCLTDPPYELGKGKESGKNEYAEYDDTRENLITLARDWLPIARATCDCVVFSPGVTNQWIYPEPKWVMCWFYGGGSLRSSWGFNCWQPFLCYGKEPGLASGNGARPDAVDMNTPANAGDIDHPCPKPVKLWDWFLDRLVFAKDAILYEPFSGSGTTMVASEPRRISVNAIELTPRYVDVAIMRWQAFTGKSATLDGDGRTFDEIAATRHGPPEV